MTTSLRLLAIVGLIAWASQITAAEQPTPARKSIAAQDAGICWLLQQQSADGGWHSATYGGLQGGVAITALAVHMLTELPDSPARHEACQRGVKFLAERIDEEGFLLDPDDADSHAVYATALFLSVLSSRADEHSNELIEKLSDALIHAQRTAAKGWQSDDLDWGGWGPIREASKGQVGDVPANISVTALVLNALQQSETLTPEVRDPALTFIRRCQINCEQGEGVGFCFTPQADHPLNKAGWQRLPDGRTEARPYHSATCDGLLALLACDRSTDEAEVSRALAAVISLSRPEFPSLPAEEEEAVFSPLQGVYFYDTAATANVWSQTQDRRLRPQRVAIRKELIEQQQAAGFWKSPLPWMREDDPLIATCLALLALRE